MEKKNKYDLVQLIIIYGIAAPMGIYEILQNDYKNAFIALIALMIIVPITFIIKNVLEIYISYKNYKEKENEHHGKKV